MYRLLLFYCTLNIYAQAQIPQLLGLTQSGGQNNLGVIFQINGDGTGYANSFSFNGFSGNSPLGSLVQASNGKLYGMTLTGGMNNNGTIFDFDASNNTFTKCFDFSNANGVGPQGNLIQATDGKLYGMTSFGGTVNGGGVIFSFDPNSNSYLKVFDFDSLSGNHPYGSLMQANDGKLYGLTSSGGTFHNGTLFSYDPSNNSFSKMHDFNALGGTFPNGSLIQASNGKLYGMTYDGGTDSLGVIFSFDVSNSNYLKIFDFNGVDGQNPLADLTEANNGLLYGLTEQGGVNGLGAIFSFNISNNSYLKVFDFDSLTGIFPGGSLIQASNANLYGMTQSGGTSNYGTIYSFTTGNVFTKIFDCTQNVNASNPTGNLIQFSAINDVREVKLVDQCRIYPNPANEFLNIGLPKSNSKIEIKITDVLGNEMDISRQTHKIDVRTWKNGVYFLTVTTVEGTETKKIIVQH